MAVRPLRFDESALRAVPARLLDELGAAGRDVVTQSRGSVTALRGGSAWVGVLVPLWVVGILGDALTTVMMMRTGRFEEANGYASVLMGAVGVGGWVLLSSLVCVAIASLSLARPHGTYAWTAAVMAAIVCLGKLWTAASNALLWATATG